MPFPDRKVECYRLLTSENKGLGKKLSQKAGKGNSAKDMPVKNGFA